MSRTTAVVTGALLGMLTLSACSSPAGPEDSGADGLVLNIVSGGTQSGIEYTELPQPIMVQLLNSKGQAVKGQIVNFRAVQGGGSVWAGASVTDAKGIAKDWWTLGGSFGRNLLEARVVDPATGEQLVLGTMVVQPTPLINPVVQFKCGNQADWTIPNSGPVQGSCYGQGGGGYVPSYPNETDIAISVRIVHNDGIPVARVHLDFYATHSSDTGTPPSVTPVYAQTNSDGIATLTFRTGSRLVLNELWVEGPGGSGIFGVQPFKAGY